MKAERRHELQTNTLAQFLSDLPLYLRFHANKIMAGVIVICLVILLVQYRMKAAREAKELTRSSLISARNGIDQIRIIDRSRPTDAQRAADRRMVASQVNSAINQILQNTTDADDASLRAEALIAQGDLNWTLANLPTLPGAATQPSLMLPQSSDDYLSNAADAYKQVLKNYESQKVAKVTALLGLAAVDENRGEWEKAIDEYNAIITDPTIVRAFKEIARQRLAMIPTLRSPVYLGAYSSTQPTTQATAVMTPTTQASTLPATTNSQ